MQELLPFRSLSRAITSVKGGVFSGRTGSECVIVLHPSVTEDCFIPVDFICGVVFGNQNLGAGCPHHIELALLEKIASFRNLFTL